MSQSSSKWTFWHTIWLLGGVIVLIGVSTFLAMTLLQHFREPAQLWAMATNLFTLFGILLAVGVAFALLAVAMSYLSLNHKLQQAQAHLAQARLHLDEYRQLTRQEQIIEEKAQKLSRAYDDLSAYPHISEMEYIHSLMKDILSSQVADFEARLLARTIKQDEQAKAAQQLAETQADEAAWQNAFQAAKQATHLWQMLLAAAPEFLHLNVQKHFLTAQLNQAHALQKLAEFEDATQQPEHYRELMALYAPVLAVEKSQDKDLNHMLYAVAHQSGVQTYQQGEWLLQNGSQKLSDIRKKWYQAQQHFQRALLMQPENAESAYQWGCLLEREARLVAQTDAVQLKEARRLWLAAREKYRMTLDADANRAEAALNWGNTLSDEATALVQTSATNFGDARILWQSAREKFKQATDINAYFDVAFHAAGITFSKEADAALRINQNADEARILWKHAGEQFQTALEINQMRFETANLWGLVLAKEADLLVQLDAGNVFEATHLWQLAQQRFHRALEIEPNLQAAASNWRTILLHEMKLLNENEQVDLLKLTQEKILSLQKVSPEHEQSAVIADLGHFVNQIQTQIQEQIKENQTDGEEMDNPETALQPPALQPITRSDQ